MSAYVVGYRTMDRVARALGFREATPAGNADMQGIGQELYAMNLCAVKARYPDSIDLPGPIDFTLGKWQYVDHAEDGRNVQALKSMHCLSYQCCEGDIPQTHLYQWLQQQIGELADELVTTTPEYDKAEWG